MEPVVILHMLAFLSGAEEVSSSRRSLPSPLNAQSPSLILSQCLSDLQICKLLLGRFIFPRVLCIEPGPCVCYPVLYHGAGPPGLCIQLAFAQRLQTALYQAWGGLKSESKTQQEHYAFSQPHFRAEGGQAERNGKGKGQL